MKNYNEKTFKICLICSSGGHLVQLYNLKEFWSKFDRVWVTFQGEESKYLLAGEKKIIAFSPTRRNIINFFRNLILAYKVIREFQPKLILSTGAGVCVPFFYIAKLLKVKTIYLESLTRINNLSLSGRLIYPFTDYLLVQWIGLEQKYRKVKYLGRLI